MWSTKVGKIRLRDLGHFEGHFRRTDTNQYGQIRKGREEKLGKRTNADEYEPIRTSVEIPQKPLGVIPCGFESRPRHFFSPLPNPCPSHYRITLFYLVADWPGTGITLLSKGHLGWKTRIA